MFHTNRKIRHRLPTTEPNVPRSKAAFGARAALAFASLALAFTAALARGIKNEIEARAESRISPPNVRPLTFNKDIAPIIFKHCAPCHHPGEVAPFSLLNYSDVKKRAKLISLVTQSRYMPPWKPEPGYGDFRGARRLTDEEIGMIKQWVEEGTPGGRADDLPPAPEFTEGWTLGKPDLILKMPKLFSVPADGPDVYHCFVVPMNLPQKTYLAGFEFRPSNRKVVHHALLVADANGSSRKLEAAPGAGYPCFGGFGFLPSEFVGGWTPGATPAREPEGIAKPLGKGSDLVIQIHFHPTGKIETEQSTVGLYLAKDAPKKVPTDITLGSIDIDIPAGARNYKVTDFYYLPYAVEILSIIPHAHYLAREIKAFATLPDGTAKPLIWIKDWDFNWQQEYWYGSPVKLPEGTRVDVEFTYDNSSDNPRNPNHPPKRVTWGEQTTDEMAELHLEVLVTQGTGAASGNTR